MSTYEKASQRLQRLGLINLALEEMEVGVCPDGKVHYGCSVPQKEERNNKLVPLRRFLKEPSAHLCAECFEKSLKMGFVKDSRKEGKSLTLHKPLGETLAEIELLSKPELFLKPGKEYYLEELMHGAELINSCSRSFQEEDYQSSGYPIDLWDKEILLKNIAERIKDHSEEYFQELSKKYPAPEKELMEKNLQDLLGRALDVELEEEVNQFTSYLQGLLRKVEDEEKEDHRFLIVNTSNPKLKESRGVVPLEQKIFELVVDKQELIWQAPLKVKHFLEECGYLNYYPSIVINQKLNAEELITLSKLNAINAAGILKTDERLSEAYRSTLALRR